MKKSALCLLLALPCLSVAEQSRQVNRSCRIYFANGTELASRLNDGRLLAELTGIKVVNRLRNADIAAGGQGAPQGTSVRRIQLSPSMRCS